MMYTRCPICKSSLHKDDRRAVCSGGHSFDFAKEGYLNLLLPDKRHSKNPGDNKEMVHARKLFLESGHYAPLAEAIAEIVNNKQNDKPLTLIDAGVGTGFYLNKIIVSRKVQSDISSRACAHAYNNNDAECDGESNLSIQNADNGTERIPDVYLGADISKTAVKYAAKLNPCAECCVASVFDLPYPDECADVVTCVFSPYALKEYRRVLKDDGILIVASPCEKHLVELRSALYDDVREVETPIPTDGFEKLSERELTYTFTLNSGDELHALLMMTPYAYRAPKDRTEKLSELKELTADFKISVLTKRKDTK